MNKEKEVRITIPEGYEIDQEKSTFDCIKFKKKELYCTWNDLPRVNGVYLTTTSRLVPTSKKKEDQDKNVFLSDKHAKAALAMAQISQLMPYYGGEITEEEWMNEDIVKYTIVVADDRIIKSSNLDIRHLLAFHTIEQRDKFLSFPENERLVKDFYMVD